MSTSPAVIDHEPVSDAADRAVAAKLTLWFVGASTLIFLVTGLLGALMRQSQADIYRLDDNFFYAVMTAHGLGAFVGWAAFAVMGFSYWVLSEVGFPMGRLGAALARVTFWLMVVGVAGVVVTTLFLGFAGSWVFLYPLPFESAGQWGDFTTGLFSASVLLVGLSIVVWCVSILVIVAGPGLPSPSTSRLTRVLTAMGFSILFPKRFPVDRPVPYAVIPLTVIAIDMIIATLPLAVLLMVMIVQSFAPEVTVDPLLAKNVLWWFGHPVVYLLLFPAVAIYYLLVPRFARRPLVAGNIIAVGWTIAVIANVTVWAHHMYLDYPTNWQAAINTTMEPLTFALTIVSALSLYSLFLTIYKSAWTWTAASTALFLGLVSWLLSGLSGVVNATIAFDVFVHNTLWIVGHFHHMALINIGIVIFGATYAFLPALLGRPLYSDRLGLWHIWLTFFAATAVSVIWMIQGLDGAPRRFAVLPGQYDATNAASVPLIALLAIAQLFFVWNIYKTLRGEVASGPPSRLTKVPRQTEAVVGLLIAMVVVSLAGWAVGRTYGEDTPAAYVPAVLEAKAAAEESPDETPPEETPPPGETPAEEPGPDPEPDPEPGPAISGESLFASSGCGGCHTMEAAGAGGSVGANLDEVAPDAARVTEVVTNGIGTMPAFSAQLDADEIAALAEYVEQSTAP